MIIITSEQTEILAVILKTVSEAIVKKVKSGLVVKEEDEKKRGCHL